MKKIYGTYRMKWTNTGIRYTPSYFLDKQYEDYKKAGLTSIKDSIIPEDRYTTELAPGIKKMTRFVVGEYNDLYVDGISFSNNISKVGAEFNIEMFSTPTDAIQWIKDNTDLLLLNETLDTNSISISAEFEISKEITDIDGNVIPAKTLIIN